MNVTVVSKGDMIQYGNRIGTVTRMVESAVICKDMFTGEEFTFDVSEQFVIIPVEELI